MNARLIGGCAFALAIAVGLMGCSGNSVKQNQQIGTACADSAQCGTGSPFFCDKNHPNGYCKRDCKSDADCPAEAICAFDGAVGACHRRCNSLDDCRNGEGYVCKPASTDKDTLASHAYCDVKDDAGGDGGISDGGITDGGSGDGKGGG